MALTFKEKAKLADAMEWDGYMYHVDRVEGDNLHYSDHKGNYVCAMNPLEECDPQFFIKITDSEIATA